MKTTLLLCSVALFAAGCATNRPTRSTEGSRSPLANPADNTLNSPVTGPSGAGGPGSTIGTSPANSAAGGLTPGTR